MVFRGILVGLASDTCYSSNLSYIAIAKNRLV
jgi:hypothetical protein